MSGKRYGDKTFSRSERTLGRGEALWWSGARGWWAGRGLTSGPPAGLL